MPESISSKKDRYVEKFDIAPQVAEIIASDKYYSKLFENSYSNSNAKDIANLITTDVIGFIDTKEKQQNSKITSQHLSDLIDAINSKTITRNSAKVALQEIMKTGKDTKIILNELDLGQVSDSSEIDTIISQIFEDEKQAVIDAKERPETVNFLVGKVMQKTNGKADPVKTLELIKLKLGQ
jgi:aspartyl-tRNA(Asn)/glutamyl-tRNA(Gln) amidotransferase subunit B